MREAAEYPNSFIPLGPQDERVETARFTPCMSAGKSWNTVQRQRFSAEEIDEVLEEVRSLLRARGRTRTQWEIGSTGHRRRRWPSSGSRCRRVDTAPRLMHAVWLGGEVIGAGTCAPTPVGRIDMLIDEFRSD